MPIVTFNPLRERGLERFKSPQHVGEMLSPDSTQLSTQYHQVKAGGDVAALFGMCKALIAWDDEAQAMGRRRVLDAGSSPSTPTASKGSRPCVAPMTGASWNAPPG